MLGPLQMDLARVVADDRTDSMLADRAARTLGAPRTALRERLGLGLVRTGLQMIGPRETRPARPQATPQS